MDGLYTSRDSGIIVEVKFFDDFAMVRPATPGFERSLRRVSLMEFLDKYDDLMCDPRPIEAMLKGEKMEDAIEAERKPH